MEEIVLQIVGGFQYQINKTNEILKKHGYKMDVSFNVQEIKGKSNE